MFLAASTDSYLERKGVSNLNMQFGHNKSNLSNQKLLPQAPVHLAQWYSDQNMKIRVLEQANSHEKSKGRKQITVMVWIKN